MTPKEIIEQAKADIDAKRINRIAERRAAIGLLLPGYVREYLRFDVCSDKWRMSDGEPCLLIPGCLPIWVREQIENAERPILYASDPFAPIGDVAYSSLNSAITQREIKFKLVGGDSPSGRPDGGSASMDVSAAFGVLPRHNSLWSDFKTWLFGKS